MFNSSLGDDNPWNTLSGSDQTIRELVESSIVKGREYIKENYPNANKEVIEALFLLHKEYVFALMDRYTGVVDKEITLDTKMAEIIDHLSAEEKEKEALVFQLASASFSILNSALNKVIKNISES